jgi:hypothetical protein
MRRPQPVVLQALRWSAQTAEHCDHPLHDTREAAVLAAAKGLCQAATVAAVLTAQDDGALTDSAAALPAGLKTARAARVAVLVKSQDPHPAVRDALTRARRHA